MADFSSVLHSLLYAFLVFCVTETQAGQRCYKRYSYYPYYHTQEYCSYGCCGPSYDEYCCGADVGLIVGCVFAAIAGISILVALICCCIKKQGHSGRVVQPATTAAVPYRPATNVTVVYSGTSGQYPGAQPQYGMQPAGAGPPQPPAYKQFDNPPPAYYYSDPAYPPVAPNAPAQPPPPPPGFGMPPSYAPQSTNQPQ